MENGILVHGCQLMVPWILTGNIHGVTPPYVTLDLALRVSTVVQMVEGIERQLYPQGCCDFASNGFCDKCNLHNFQNSEIKFVTGIVRSGVK